MSPRPKVSCWGARSTPRWCGSRTQTSRGDPRRSVDDEPADHKRLWCCLVELDGELLLRDADADAEDPDARDGTLHGGHAERVRRDATGLERPARLARCERRPAAARELRGSVR